MKQTPSESHSLPEYGPWSESENLFEVFPEDYYEFIPEKGWVLLRSAVVMLEKLRQFLPRGRLYTEDEMQQALYRGDYKLPNTGRLKNIPERGSWAANINNLWRCGRVRKYAKGYYVQSGRPYGIQYDIHSDD